MKSPMLEAIGIAKYFGDITAISGVAVALRKMKIAAIVGSEGRGRPTLVGR
jgi:ABC-type branched-subunit amino acid transport system ATPase component